MLRLRTLGGLVVDGGAAPLGRAATQHQSLALLALLARASERPLSRPKLVAYLWPDAVEGQAGHRLSQLIYALRLDLRCDAFFVGRTELRLNPEHISSDVAEFLAALAGGDLEHTANLYQGPFLDGFYLRNAAEFERWAEDERAYLRSRHVGALESLAARATRRGDGKAVEWWRRLAAAEPLSSRVAAGLMEAMAAAGDRGGALRFAQAHEVLVRQELDAAPSAAVVGLATRLKTRSIYSGRVKAGLGRREGFALGGRREPR